MSLLTDLTDLMASAPPGVNRELIDRASAEVAGGHWHDAARWIDRVPPGCTTWHERLEAARERIASCEIDDDCGFLDQFEDY